MARSKRRAGGKAALQIEVLETRDCPGQTLTGLAPFAAGVEAIDSDSEQIVSIGGATRRLF